MAVLPHEKIEHHSERISLLQSCEDQYNWLDFEFPIAIQKINKLEKNNLDIAANVLFNSKKGMYTATQVIGQSLMGSVASKSTYWWSSTEKIGNTLQSRPYQVFYQSWT